MTATLTIGDTSYDVEVAEIEFASDGEYLRDDFSSPYQHNVQFAQQTVTLSGTIRGMTLRVTSENEEERKEPEMGYPREDRCETACDGEYSPLSKKVTDLDLGEDDRLLRKYRVESSDGTLTGNGADVLLALLYKDNKDKVVKALKALEEAEKKK